MKIDFEGMEELRDVIRSAAISIDASANAAGQEVYDKIHPHILDLYDFVKEVVSGEGKWQVRSDDDSFDD